MNITNNCCGFSYGELNVQMNAELLTVPHFLYDSFQQGLQFHQKGGANFVGLLSNPQLIPVHPPPRLAEELGREFAVWKMAQQQ